MDICQICLNQKSFFQKDITKDASFRIKTLKKLKNLILLHQNEIFDALKKDLNKSYEEAFVSEFALVLKELNFAIKNTKKLSYPKLAKPSLLSPFSLSFIVNEPLGLVLIISPWNYPLYLSLTPMISAIAAGNCVVLKMSSRSKFTSEFLINLINSNFESDYIFATTERFFDSLIEAKFDYIFFTGGAKTAKKLQKIASKNLTPLTLELGGKSPCVILQSANLLMATKRIAWAKLLNASQTCIAPDTIFVPQNLLDNFLNLLNSQINTLYKNPLQDENYPKMIDERAFVRALNLASECEVTPKNDKNSLKIAPTFIINPPKSCKINTKEIFAPLFLIKTFQNEANLLNELKRNPKPLAFYIFGKNGDISKFSQNLSFGGGCKNDCLMHISNLNLPFGGVGASGFGKYHGVFGFETFSNKKAILRTFF